MARTQKIFSSRQNRVNADNFIGEKGRLFYDEPSSPGVPPLLRYSDGSTVGGLPFAVSTTVNSNPPSYREGALWWDSNDGNLYIAYNDQWVSATYGGNTSADGTLGYYASAIDTSTQGLLSTTNAQTVNLSTMLESNGISLSSNLLTFSEAGTYSVTWSIQLTNTDNAIQTADIWFVLNSNAVVDSNSRFDVPSAKSGTPGHTVGTVNLVLTVNAGATLGLKWSGSDTKLKLETLVAGTNPTRPQVPSVILSVTQVMNTQAGPQGYTGSIGSIGGQGYVGSVGNTGLQGEPGYAGSIGDTGPQGPQGELGYTGSIGDTGLEGPQGPQGEQGYVGSIGDVGSQGELGYAGSIGDTGPQGPQGELGYTGSIGDTGPQGPQGEQGYVGSIGDVGPQGPIGYTGSQGQDGTSINIHGTVIDSSYLPSSGQQLGDAYIADDTKDIWVYSNSVEPGSINGFVNIGNIIGPTGYTGSEGYSGSIGDTGPQGPQGELGYAGSIGDTGPQGPLGYDGSIGDTGPQGYTGSVGNTGPQGYTGSVGNTGPQGYTGSVGNTGPQGLQGYTGSTGLTGYTFTGTGTVIALATSPTFTTSIDGGATFSAFGSSTALTVGNASGTITLNGTATVTANNYVVGYRDIPQIGYTGSATLAATDGGKHYYSTVSTNTTLTIPPNSSIALATGTTINIVNLGTGTIAIARGLGVTLYLAGSSTNSDRSLASYGAATLQKVATDTWIVVGVGLT